MANTKLPKGVTNLLNKKVPEKNGVSIVILGAGRSGKSNLMRKLINDWVPQFYTGKKKPVIACFTKSPNSEELKLLQKKNPQIPVYPYGLDDPPEEEDENESRGKKKRKTLPIKVINDMRKAGRSKNQVYSFVLMDDISDMRDINTVRDIILHARNDNMSCILTTHRHTFLSPAVRDTINFLIFRRFNGAEGKETICKTFLKPHIYKADMDLLIRLYDELTSEYGYILVDNLAGEAYVIDSNLGSYKPILLKDAYAKYAVLFQ